MAHASYSMIAAGISRLSDPLVTISYLLFLTVWMSGARGASLISLAGYIIGICVLPPVFFLFLAVKKQWVSNWDLSNRRERIRALSFGFLFLVIDAFVMCQLPYPVFRQMMTFMIVLFLGFFLITLFWKISGHMTFITAALFMTMYLFGWAWWPVFLILPVIGWSRVVLRRHTIAQVVAGVFYAGIMSFLLLPYMLPL